MKSFTVQTGHKFWCTRQEDDGSDSVLLATPGMGGAVIVEFDSYARAWAWASKKLDDEYGNKFQIVEKEMGDAGHIIEVPAIAENEVSPRPKRRKKRSRRK